MRTVERPSGFAGGFSNSTPHFVIANLAFDRNPCQPTTATVAESFASLRKARGYCVRHAACFAAQQPSDLGGSNEHENLDRGVRSGGRLRHAPHPPADG
jgi:hypothetical protein